MSFPTGDLDQGWNFFAPCCLLLLPGRSIALIGWYPFSRLSTMHPERGRLLRTFKQIDAFALCIHLQTGLCLQQLWSRALEEINEIGYGPPLCREALESKQLLVDIDNVTRISTGQGQEANPKVLLKSERRRIGGK